MSKLLWNMLLAIKKYLRLQMEPNIRNIRWIMQLKIKFTQRSYDTSIWTENTIQSSHLHQNSCRDYHTTWETNRYTRQSTSPDVQYHRALLGIKILESESEWFIESINPFELDILINKLSSWNYQNNSWT